MFLNHQLYTDRRWVSVMVDLLQSTFIFSWYSLVVGFSAGISWMWTLCRQLIRAPILAEKREYKWIIWLLYTPHFVAQNENLLRSCGGHCHIDEKLWYESGPSCSKLTMSLVNDSLKFTLSDMQICWNFLLKKCEQLLQCKSYSHFSATNIRILCIESAKTLTKWPLTSSLS